MISPAGNSQFCFAETLSVSRGEALLYFPTQN